jgi:hypothetical protein
MASNPQKRFRGRLILRIFFGCGGWVFLLGFLQILVTKRGVLDGELWCVCGVLRGWKCA